MQVVEDGYEFFADRQLVTIFSAPNYCGEFDNAGAMMSVDESLMCSFQILKPADRRPRFLWGSVQVPFRKIFTSCFGLSSKISVVSKALTSHILTDVHFFSNCFRLWVTSSAFCIHDYILSEIHSLTEGFLMLYFAVGTSLEKEDFGDVKAGERDIWHSLRLYPEAFARR